MTKFRNHLLILHIILVDSFILGIQARAKPAPSIGNRNYNSVQNGESGEEDDGRDENRDLNHNHQKGVPSSKYDHDGNILFGRCGLCSKTGRQNGCKAQKNCSSMSELSDYDRCLSSECGKMEEGREQNLCRTRMCIGKENISPKKKCDDECMKRGDYCINLCRHSRRHPGKGQKYR